MQQVHSIVIDSLLSKEINNENNIVFLKGCRQNMIPEVIKMSANYSEDIQILYYRYERDRIQPAFCPFMDWIKNLYVKYYKDEMSIEDLLDLADVYMLHREVISSFLSSGICNRSEDMIFREATYEADKFSEDVIKLMQFLTKKAKIFILIDDFHYAQLSAIEFITGIVESVADNKFFMLVNYNDTYVADNYIRQKLDVLMLILDSKNMVVECGNHENIEFKMVSEEIIDLNWQNIREKIEVIQNMYYMCTFSQAEHYLDYIYKNIKFSGVKYEKKDVFDIIEQYILVSLSLKNNMFAGALCNEIADYAFEDSDEQEYRINYLKCLTQSRLGKRNMAMNYCSECIRIAERMSDEYRLFKARVLYHMCFIDFGSIDGMRLLRRNQNDEIDELVEELKEHKFYNTLIYIYIGYYEKDVDTLRQLDKNNEKLEFFIKSVELAKKINNQFFLDRAYDKKRLTVYSAGCINLREWLINESTNSLSNAPYSFAITTFASLGYYYTMREEYAQAHKNNYELLSCMYDKYSKEVKREGINNDIVEFLRIYYNIAMNCLSARNYDCACDYLIKVTSQMEKINLVDIYVSDLAKLYSMTAFCFSKLNNEYMTVSYIEKAKVFISNSIDKDAVVTLRDDTLFFYYIVLAILDLKTEEIKSAKNNLEIASTFYKKCMNQEFLLFPIWQETKFNILIAEGNDEKIKEAFDEMYEYCRINDRHELENYTRSVQAGNEANINSKEDFFIEDELLSKIETLISFKKLEDDIINETRNSEYLIRLQETLSQSFMSTDEIIDNVMVSVKNYIGFDEIVYISASDNIVLYSNNSEYIAKYEIVNIVDFFNTYKAAFIINRTQRSYYAFRKLTDILDSSDIVTFVGVPVYVDGKLERVFIGLTRLRIGKINNDSIINKNNLNVINLAVNYLISKEYVVASVDAAVRANKAKSEFLNNIIKEFRKPIGTILNADEIIADKTDSLDIAECAVDIQNAGRMLISVLDDVKDFNKIEDKKLQIKEIRYDTAAMINALMHKVASKTSDKKTTVNVDIDSYLPSQLYGDESRIKQVTARILTNIINCAEDGYMDISVMSTKVEKNNGHNTVEEFILEYVSDNTDIRTNYTGNNHFIVNNIDKDDEIILSVLVKHTGTRLNVAKLKESFESTIVKELLIMLNCGIKIIDNNARETSIILAIEQKAMSDREITLIDEWSTNAGVSKNQVRYIMSKANILMIDDNRLNLVEFGRALRKTQINIDYCDNLDDCYEKIKRKRYDIIFLDFVFSDTNGDEVLKNIRNTENMCRITPVIALIDDNVYFERRMCLEAGFRDCLGKPYDASQLERMVVQYLSDDLVTINEYDNEEAFDYEFNSIDTHVGIQISGGSAESYIETIKTFSSASTDIIGTLKNCFEKRDMFGYEKCVRALKSSSMGIGAVKLSESALMLELAAKDGKIELIQLNHPVMLKEYVGVLNEIREYLFNSSSDSGIYDIEPDKLIIKLIRINDYLLQFAMHKAKKAADELKGCRCRKLDVSSKLESIREKMDDYDVDSAAADINQLIGQVADIYQ